MEKQQHRNGYIYIFSVTKEGEKEGYLLFLRFFFLRFGTQKRDGKALAIAKRTSSWNIWGFQLKVTFCTNALAATAGTIQPTRIKLNQPLIETERVKQRKYQKANWAFFMVV